MVSCYRQWIRFSGLSSHAGRQGEVKWCRDEKTKLAGIVLLPRLMRRQRGPPDSSLQFWRVSVLLCDMGRYARWLVCDVNPTHTCQNATTLAGAGHAQSLSWEKPVCFSAPITNLQQHPRIWGHPNMVITPQFLEGWSGALRSSLVCCLLTVCVSICWYGEQTQLDFSVEATLEARHTWQLSDIILQFHGILNIQTIVQPFKELVEPIRNNNQ